MKYELALVLFLTFFPAAAWAKKVATGKAATPAVPGLLQEIEKKYSKAQTLIAVFSQQDELAALKRKKSSSGRISIRRPDKVRWETVKPNPSIFVSDGKQVWLYTPPFDESESGELRVRKASEIHSRLAQALLSGSFSMATDMKIAAVSPSDFTLTPRTGSAGSVLKAMIHVDLEKKLIDRVTLEHRGGNRTEITLNDIELGRDIPEDTFHFSAPPNTVTVKD